MSEVPQSSIICSDREFFIDSLLVRIHFIIEIIWWTGLEPWEFEFPFPGGLIPKYIQGMRPDERKQG